MKEIAESLSSIVQEAESRLLMMSDEDASQRPAPGKWSAKEIIGHLVDSATNNYRRFVMAPQQDHLVFDGYDQDAWVSNRNYQVVDWGALIALWKQYNVHLTALIEQIPEAIAQREVTRHNLHQIAWQTVPENQPATLAYFIEDYVNHLSHHLGQIYR